MSNLSPFWIGYCQWLRLDLEYNNNEGKTYNDDKKRLC